MSNEFFICIGKSYHCLYLADRKEIVDAVQSSPYLIYHPILSLNNFLKGVHCTDTDMNKEETIDHFELDDDEKRIAHILAPGQKIGALPVVSLEMLDKYYQYLSQNLPANLRLTGQESVGYFAWEEKFDFGYGSEKEYDRLRKQQASYHDKFKLICLKNIDPVYGIVVTVLRITDNKKFNIPLADLEACDGHSNEYVLIKDYSMWFVNYNGC
jgi:hypothetical protein